MPNGNQTALGAIIGGAWRFALVSIGGFGVWAFESKLLPKGVSEVGLYIGCLVVFVVLAELFLAPLVQGSKRFARFNGSFVPAFIAYAIVWSACWFALRSKTGEWLGCAAGCAVFAWILGKRLRAKSGFVAAIVLLIATHAAGYFIGGEVFAMRRNPPGLIADWPKRDILTLAKLAWGLCYGLGFGAGIGYAFHVFQKAGATQPEPTA
jgi:hypothetical protein